MSNTQSRRHILRVPGELIFKCLEYLLPAIHDTSDFRYPLAIGDLSDLLRCRLVCHVFYVVSSSLVWRRVKLVFPGYRSSNPSAISVAHEDVSKVAEITRFLLRSSHFIKDIRLLIILTNGPRYEQAMYQDTVPAFLRLIPSFTNVRVLNLENVSILGSDVMLQLFLRPSLHTVRLGNIDFSRFSSLGRPVNPNIKSLAIHRCRRPAELFRVMPSVQAFDGEIDEASLRTIRWPSLNEVSFRSDIPVWDDIARTFLSWRQSRPLSLTELMISQWNFNPKIKNLFSIIQPFIGNPLTKLILYYVEEPSVENLDLIIRFFPSLQHLSLLSDEELVRWPGNIETYSDRLSRLNQLRLLEWNFYDDDTNDNTVYGDWNMVSEDRLSEMVLCLADHCRYLREVRFCLVIDGYMGLTLSKNDSGTSDIENIFYSDSLTFSTSSWAPYNFSDA